MYRSVTTRRVTGTCTYDNLRYFEYDSDSDGIYDSRTSAVVVSTGSNHNYEYVIDADFEEGWGFGTHSQVCTKCGDSYSGNCGRYHGTGETETVIIDGVEYELWTDYCYCGRVTKYYTIPVSKGCVIEHTTHFTVYGPDGVSIAYEWDSIETYEGAHNNVKCTHVFNYDENYFTCTHYCADCGYYIDDYYCYFYENGGYYIEDSAGGEEAGMGGKPQSVWVRLYRCDMCDFEYGTYEEYSDGKLYNTYIYNFSYDDNGEQIYDEITVCVGDCPHWYGGQYANYSFEIYDDGSVSSYHDIKCNQCGKFTGAGYGHCDFYLGNEYYSDLSGAVLGNPDVSYYALTREYWCYNCAMRYTVYYFTANNEDYAYFVWNYDFGSEPQNKLLTGVKNPGGSFDNPEGHEHNWYYSFTSVHDGSAWHSKVCSICGMNGETIVCDGAYAFVCERTIEGNVLSGGYFVCYQCGMSIERYTTDTAEYVVWNVCEDGSFSYLKRTGDDYTWVEYYYSADNAAYIAPEENVPYYFYLDNGTTYYFTGKMDGYYLGTTTESYEAVAVYFEIVEGGYHIYFMEGDTKTYLNAKTTINTDSGKLRCQFAFDTTANTVWTYDASYGVFEVYAELDGMSDTYFAGTYSSFTTMSLSSTYYKDGIANGTQFPARIAKIEGGSGGEIKPDEHVCYYYYSFNGFYDGAPYHTGYCYGCESSTDMNSCNIVMKDFVSRTINGKYFSGSSYECYDCHVYYERYNSMDMFGTDTYIVYYIAEDGSFSYLQYLDGSWVGGWNPGDGSGSEDGSEDGGEVNPDVPTPDEPDVHKHEFRYETVLPETLKYGVSHENICIDETCAYNAGTSPCVFVQTGEKVRNEIYGSVRTGYVYACKSCGYSVEYYVFPVETVGEVHYTIWMSANGECYAYETTEFKSSATSDANGNCAAGKHDYSFELLGFNTNGDPEHYAICNRCGIHTRRACYISSNSYLENRGTQFNKDGTTSIIYGYNCDCGCDVQYYEFSQQSGRYMEYVRAYTVVDALGYTRQNVVVIEREEIENGDCAWGNHELSYSNLGPNVYNEIVHSAQCVYCDYYEVSACAPMGELDATVHNTEEYGDIVAYTYYCVCGCKILYCDYTKVGMNGDYMVRFYRITDANGIENEYVLHMGMIEPECDHLWVAPTCTSDGYCVRCGKFFAYATGHNFIDGICVNCGGTNGNTHKCDYIYIKIGGFANGTTHHYMKCESCGESRDNVPCNYGPAIATIFNDMAISYYGYGYTCYDCGNYYEIYNLSNDFEGEKYMVLYDFREDGSFELDFYYPNMKEGECLPGQHDYSYAYRGFDENNGNPYHERICKVCGVCEPMGCAAIVTPSPYGTVTTPEGETVNAYYYTCLCDTMVIYYNYSVEEGNIKYNYRGFEITTVDGMKESYTAIIGSTFVDTCNGKHVYSDYKHMADSSAKAPSHRAYCQYGDAKDVFECSGYTELIGTRFDPNGKECDFYCFVCVCGAQVAYYDYEQFDGKCTYVNRYYEVKDTKYDNFDYSLTVTIDSYFGEPDTHQCEYVYDYSAGYFELGFTHFEKCTICGACREIECGIAERGECSIEIFGRTDIVDGTYYGRISSCDECCYYYEVYEFTFTDGTLGLAYIYDIYEDRSGFLGIYTMRPQDICSHSYAFNYIGERPDGAVIHFFHDMYCTKCDYRADSQMCALNIEEYFESTLEINGIECTGYGMKCMNCGVWVEHYEGYDEAGNKYIYTLYNFADDGGYLVHERFIENDMPEGEEGEVELPDVGGGEVVAPGVDDGGSNLPFTPYY